MRDFPADVWVSDQPNADGNYECVQQPVNTAPPAPASITYGTPVAGQNIVLTCEAYIDPDGDMVQYIWEYRVDGGVYTQIGITSEPSIIMIVPESGETYQARVKAVDSGGNESEYTAGSIKPLRESSGEKLLNSPSCIHVSMLKLLN